MTKQNFELKNDAIREAFADKMKTAAPEAGTGMNLSWSNWGFGLEPLRKSAARLRKAGIEYIELHGNHYGPDLGYKAGEVCQILDHYGIRTSGICGMFSAENDLSGNNAFKRPVSYTHLTLPTNREV